MNSIRKNLVLPLVLATLFVAQLFVPIAIAKSQAGRAALGIIICTSAGLKLLTPDGQLQSVGDDKSDRQNQENCYICLTGGCTFATNVTSGSHLVWMYPNKADVFSIVFDQVLDRDVATNHIRVRAPPQNQYL